MKNADYNLGRRDVKLADNVTASQMGLTAMDIVDTMDGPKERWQTDDYWRGVIEFLDGM